MTRTHVKDRYSQRKRRVVLTPCVSDPQWVWAREQVRNQRGVRDAQSTTMATHETKLGVLRGRADKASQHRVRHDLSPGGHAPGG